MSLSAWRPLLDRLAEPYDAIAVDLPGHGRSPVGSTDEPPTPEWFARQLVRFVDDLGLRRVHVAGVSFGGWIALEFAAKGRARSVTAVCPGGQWVGDMPAFVNVSLTLTRALTRAFRGALPLLVRPKIGRRLLLAQMFHDGGKLTAEEAAEVATNFADCPGYDLAFAAVKHERFSRGNEVAVPTTIAYAKKDRLMLPSQSQHRELAPPEARLVDLERCGHVPIWDAPDAVVRVIRETVEMAGEGTVGRT